MHKEPSRASFFVWVFYVRARLIFRKMAQGTGGTVSLSIDLISLLSPLYLFWLDSIPVTFFSALLMGVSFFSVILLMQVIVAWRSLNENNPAEYAHFALDGLRVSEILRFVSYEIIFACEQITQSDCVQSLSRFASDNFPNGIKHDLAQSSKAFVSHETKLRGFASAVEDIRMGQETKIKRLLELKSLASRLLDIPPRRLCDYVFQYSPTMHRYQLQKYIDNWATLIDNHKVLQSGDQSAIERMDALEKENKRIIEKFDSRIKLLRQLWLFADLHKLVHQFASEHSTSSAVMNYAKALTRVSRECLLDGSRHDYEHKRQLVWNRLRFLMFKQRAYPGFDLHYTLLHLCNMESGKGANVSTQKRLKNYKEVLNLMRDNPAREQATIFRMMTELGELSQDIENSIAHDRAGIINNFEEYFAKWQIDAETILVTHGYSKTVREVMKRGLRNIFENELERAEHILGRIMLFEERRALARKAIPRIFIMNSSDSDNFETRLMEYDLKDDPNYAPLNDITAGDERLLARLLEPSTNVLVVIGAECFDREKRVLHPRGISSRLGSLRDMVTIQKCRFSVVVLAEEYKRHTSLVDISEFYTHHLDTVDLCSQGQIDVIITETETLT